MKTELIAIALIGSLVGISEAQQPTCEEQLAVSNQLLQDFAQGRGKAEFDLAQWKVKAAALEKVVAESKAKENKEKPGKDHGK